MNRSADAGQTASETFGVWEEEEPRTQAPFLWMGLDALNALRLCPDYPRALVAYVALMEAANWWPRPPLPDVDPSALDDLIAAGLVTRNGEHYTLGPADPALSPQQRPEPPECVYCGGDAGHRDHVVPRSRGGKRKGNLVPACAPCNVSKGARDVREWVERKGLDWPTIEARILAHGVTTL